MYDAIVVGARCAGSPLAMLLARKGLRVLLCDKAEFPSDVISTHFLHPRGGSYLSRWGLYKRVLANTPKWANHNVVLDGIHLTGHPEASAISARLTAAHGWRRQEEVASVVTTFCAPRRHTLDTILAQAAGEAGAEMRLGFGIEDLLREGDRVVGVRGRSRGGGPITERARIVIGADGRHSRVARAAGAKRYDEKLKCTYCYYSFWSDYDTSRVKPFPALFVRGRVQSAAVLTTDNQLSVIAVGPREWFQPFRRDIPGNFQKTLEFLNPDLAECVRAARRVDRFYGTADQPNFFCKPFGLGWALVGDAGYQKDQCTAIGMTHAFRDAELLADAVAEGLSGPRPMEATLAEYEERRNADSKDYYDFVCMIAECNPHTRDQVKMFRALSGSQAHMNEFFGLFGDVIPPRQFFTPEHMEAIFADARHTTEPPEVIADYDGYMAKRTINPFV